ncbi:MAG: hypothetical protein A2Y53_05225 [Chloroflexi bacterium RBG_16_47_49]|nr:MAG: hypothetical protein A2Y53_05225 [Chloroflexi bacterium RBG_16_47_49]
MCVWGNIRSTIYDEGNLQINFGPSKGDFYIQTDDTNPPHKIGVECVMITDEIQQFDGSPVIVWERPNVLYFWDCK